MVRRIGTALTLGAILAWAIVGMMRPLADAPRVNAAVEYAECAPVEYTAPLGMPSAGRKE
jgi:hypothetical protein